jgi:hypothetical protein
MPRMAAVPAVLTTLFDAKAIVLENGKPMLRVVVTRAKVGATNGETEEVSQKVDVYSFVGVNDANLLSFIKSKDATAGVKMDFRRSSEEALKKGVIDAKSFDALFGKGEAAKVVPPATP